MEAVLWVVLAVVLAIAEAFTATILVVFFAAGALAAAGAAALGADLLVQVIVFAIVSGVSVAALRPVILRHARPALETGERPFGIEAIEGSRGTVIDEVTGDRGMVKIDGELWQARSVDDRETFAPGERVRVVRLRGATLMVWHDDLPNV
ncbi:membrane protein [Actinoplanes italicus]|uniref:Membrane protein implicated in regulation of membrane protease activity n=1 Tax=Actinoplanes italicus TaxID=113567 RepID=A0A2T0JJ13_9ACTN|nr:NfeD family protein [Actinoplanes italicus]PRX07422.1 membrane protein implicated in regulation of membrane protease activity [Actinoplanes italicus]GIE35960.1 membrane protein [Actinoplanes italicus]